MPKEVDDLHMKVTNDDLEIFQPMNEITPKEISDLRGDAIPQVSIEDLEKEMAQIESHKDEIGREEIYEAVKNTAEDKRLIEWKYNDSIDHDVDNDQANLREVEPTERGSFGTRPSRFIITTAIDTFKELDWPADSCGRSNIELGILHKDFRISECYSPPEGR